MNLRELEYLVAVDELKHFSKAADRCAVSQPTLSAQLKKLEAELGVALFERTNKRVMPTGVGQSIIQSARQILTEVKAIRETAATAQDPYSGHYRLGAFPTLASYLFPDLVLKLRASMPSLKIVLLEEKSDDLLAKVREGEIDAAFLALPIDNDFFVAEHLFDDPFFLAVSEQSDLALQNTVDTDALRDQKLMLLEEGHCLRDQSLAVCDLLGLSDEPDMRGTSLETLRQMVRAGTGVTLFPAIATQSQHNGIKYIPFDGDGPLRSIGLVRRKTCARTQVFDRVKESVVELGY